MTGKKIIYYILAAFIIGNLFLIYIQYNSAKNINALIEGNEKVLTEFKVTGDLRELESDITSVETKIGGTLYTKNATRLESVDGKIKEVKADLANLQKISDDDTSVKYIDVLDFLVNEKIAFSNQVLETLKIAGKNAAEDLIVSARAKNLNDSIELITNIIESSRQKLLARATLSIDKSGERALNFGSVLIALVLISGAALFWLIINTIRKQNLLIVQLNISEKKVRESAQVKENFLANMSHEIRTPMNAMLGFTNLLQRKNLDSEAKEYVQTIQNSGEKLLTLINDILDLSKIEAGMMRIEAAPFSMRSLLHSVETMFKVKAAEKKVALTTIVDDALPDTLEGDATRLTQILINLISNALKFTNEGSIVIKISNEGKNGNIINTGICVSDTGIGIAKKNLQTVFDRFQQAEDSVTRKYGGTGLGLSIVQDLVAIQHGTIEVESEPGKGTTFTLVIPYAITEEQSVNTIASGNAVIDSNDFENISVLVVEDNAINQNLLRHIFSNWQLAFDLANNGVEAIEKLTTNSYHLIIMDIQMPEMDGYTATQEIRNTLRLTTPIIAMTAHALAGEREKCLSFGMNEYISKPIREEQLHQLITRFTHETKPVFLKKTAPAKPGNDAYRYINLHYMREVSNGNLEYEKTVTEQFIEAIPADLDALEKAWKINDTNGFRQLAHNMKTTVSVMGLNEILQPYLDNLEYENLDEAAFKNTFAALRVVCEGSLTEARQFYSSF